MPFIDPDGNEKPFPFTLADVERQMRLNAGEAVPQDDTSPPPGERPLRADAGVTAPPATFTQEQARQMWDFIVVLAGTNYDTPEMLWYTVETASDEADAVRRDVLGLD